MSVALVRDDKSLRAEIRDLSEYISGLPDELRTSGAFVPYEDRLHELRERLAVTELQNLDFPLDSVVDLIERQNLPKSHGASWLVELRKVARQQVEIRSREATFHYRLTLFLSVGALIGAASAGVTALAVPIAGTLLAGAAATLTAILLFSDMFRKLQREQVDLVKLLALRSELEVLFVRNSEQGLGEKDVRELSQRVVFLFSEQTP